MNKINVHQYIGEAELFDWEFRLLLKFDHNASGNYNSGTYGWKLIQEEHHEITT